MCIGDTPTSPIGVQVADPGLGHDPQTVISSQCVPEGRVFSLVPGLLGVHVLGKAPWVGVKAVLEGRVCVRGPGKNRRQR